MGGAAHVPPPGSGRSVGWSTRSAGEWLASVGRPGADGGSGRATDPPATGRSGAARRRRTACGPSDGPSACTDPNIWCGYSQTMAVVLITGATRGIGEAAALELAARGAEVAIVGPRPGARAGDRGAAAAGGGAPCTSTSPTSSGWTRSARSRPRCASATSASTCSPTTPARCSPPRHETADGLRAHVRAQPPRAVPAHEPAARPARRRRRVVTTSTDAHRAGAARPRRPPVRARATAPLRVYGTTKLCNILFTRELARRAPELHATCFHPGVVRTGFGKNDGSAATRLGTTLTRPVPALARRAAPARSSGSRTRTRPRELDRRLRRGREGRRAERAGAGRRARGRAVGAQRGAGGRLMALAFPALERPIVQAPMAGGPSTPALAAAVSDAGGLGFLAAGYQPARRWRADIARGAGADGAPFGVNLFLARPAAVDGRRARRVRGAARAEARAPRRRARRAALRRRRFDGEARASSAASGRAVVSFTFGCPSRRRRRAPARARDRRLGDGDRARRGARGAGRRRRRARRAGRRGGRAPRLVRRRRRPRRASALLRAAARSSRARRRCRSSPPAGSPTAPASPPCSPPARAPPSSGPRSCAARRPAPARAARGARAAGADRADARVHRPPRPRHRQPRSCASTPPTRRPPTRTSTTSRRRCGAAARAAGDADAINLWAGRGPRARARTRRPASSCARWSAEARAALEPRRAGSAARRLAARWHALAATRRPRAIRRRDRRAARHLVELRQRLARRPGAEPRRADARRRVGRPGVRGPRDRSPRGART